MRKLILIGTILFLVGCGGSVAPSSYWQKYEIGERNARIENLERTGREARIGEMFPNIASKPSY